MSWLELFFDLVFVAAIAQIGTPLAAHYSFAELGRYAGFLLVVWWAWHGYAVYATRFDNDDLAERAATVLQMVAVLFMAANAEEGIDSESSAGFAAAYAVMRVILAGRYVRARRRPGARRLALDYATGFGVAAAVWLVSSLVPAPWRFGCWVVALVLDLGTARVASRHTLALPPHATHLPERFGLFTLILLGEGMVAVMKGILHQPVWSVRAAATALSAVGLLCAVWWGYFEAAGAADHRHVRCDDDCRSLTVWSHAHLPLYLGVAVLGIGAEHAIVGGGWQTLSGEETWLVVLAIALTGLAIAILGQVRAVDRPGAALAES